MTGLPAKTTFYLILEAVFTGLLLAWLLVSFYDIMTPAIWIISGVAVAILIKSVFMWLFWDPITASIRESLETKR